MNSRIKYILIFFVIVCFCLCSCISESNSLSEYLITDVPLIYPERLIFPQFDLLDACEVNQYKSVSKSTLFFDDVYFLLRCTYSSSQYEQEILRLEQVGAVYSENLFSYSAYVMLLYEQYYEYALLDIENCTIIYVFAQTTNLEDFDDFPKQYCPNDTADIDICQYSY